MNYAVIKTSGSQYLVSPGDVLTLPNLSLKEGDKIIFSEVLLSNVDAKVQIGSPLISGFTVKGTVKKNFQGEKLDIYKFKAKSRYRRHMGFRAQLTLVEIDNFTAEKSKPKKAVSKKKAL